MEVTVTSLVDADHVTSISYANDVLLTLSTPMSEGGLVLTQYRLPSSAAPSSAPLSAQQTLELSKKTRISKAILDHSATLIYASLKKQPAVLVFPVEALASTTTKPHFKPCNLRFQARVFSLTALNPSNNSLVVAVSTAAEISFLQGHVGKRTEIRHYEKLPLQTVLATSSFHNDQVVVFGVQDDRLVFMAIRVALESTLQNARITVSPAVSLPTPSHISLPPSSKTSSSKSSTTGLTASVWAHCIVLVWEDGTVNVVVPDNGSRAVNRKSTTLDAWISPLVSENTSRHPPMCLKSFQLAPQPFRDAAAATMSEQQQTISRIPANVAPLGEHVIAISYGQCISFWDTTHFQPQKYLDTGNMIQLAQTHNEGLLVGDDRGVHVLQVVGNKLERIPTLLSAIRGRRSCDTILKRTHEAGMVKKRVHAHALTSGPLRTAADAGGDSGPVFERTLLEEQEREMRDVRAVVSKEMTKTAEDLYEVGRKYFEWVGGKTNVGAGRLPSDRLAAVFVARCIHEICVNADAGFAVPLIDMVGTGGVSMQDVFVTLTVSETWDMGDCLGNGKKQSVVRGLTSSHNGMFVNVLESVVMGVGDLTESELLWTMVYAGELRKKYGAGGTASGKKKDGMGERKDRCLGLAAKRLLRRCVTVGVDREVMLERIGELGLGRAMMLLSELETLLTELQVEEEECESVLQEVERETKEAEETTRRKRGSGNGTGMLFSKEIGRAYRGKNRWLDQRREEGEDGDEGCGSHGSAMRGCAEWMGLVVDGHMMSMLLEKRGRKTAGRLLKKVRGLRERSDVLRGLEGMSMHLGDGLCLPRVGGDAGMYAVREVGRVPAEMLEH